jgi:hypothetical protein
VKARTFAGLVVILLTLMPSCRPPDAAGETDPALSALVDSLLPAVERVSLLSASRPVRVDVRSPDQVRQFVVRKLDQELPAPELEGIRRVYARLGLIPEDLDLRALLLELFSEQIAGYYDPETETLHVLRGASLPSLRPVLIHEMVHALQDQHANLDSLISRERGNDRQTAAQAALEGHATLAMFALLAEEASGAPVDPVTLPDPASQLRPAFEDPSGQFPVFRSAPRVIRETLVFPYAAGSSYVQQLWRAAGPVAERRAPLGALLPQSTEQVMHPMQKFIPVLDPPTELRFTGFGDWRSVYENTLGALETGILLEEHLGRIEAPAWGWDGDRYALLERPDGVGAVVWASVWDDVASADRFAERMTRVLQDGASDRTGIVERIEIETRPAVLVRITGMSVPASDIPRPGLSCVDPAGRAILCALR